MKQFGRDLAYLYQQVQNENCDDEQKQLNRFNFLQHLSGHEIPDYVKTDIMNIELDYLINMKVTKRPIKNKRALQSDFTFESFQKFRQYDEDKFKTEQLIEIQKQKEIERQKEAKLQRQDSGNFFSKVFNQVPQQEQIKDQQQERVQQGFIQASVKAKINQRTDELSETGSKSIQRKFKPPSKISDKNSELKCLTNTNQQSISYQKRLPEQQEAKKQNIQDPRLKNLEPSLIEKIESEIMDGSVQNVQWQDIAGLEYVRSQIEEIAIWPLLNPELFQGITQPGSGLLLFGPPGTGKTMIGKAIANEAKATFFNISASSLTSKYIGEAEKLVKTLFVIATMKQPSVIFIDEIDSMLSARQEKENEGSRSMKTEFMVQLDGAHKTGGERVLLVGATNRPQELDDAIKRRFTKKLYIPLPNKAGREEQIKIIIRNERQRGKKSQFTEQDISQMVDQTKGYSGADMKNLCTEMFMIPIRQAIRVYGNDLKSLKAEAVRETNYKDFLEAIKTVKPTIQQKDLQAYFDWNKEFGSYNFQLNELDC